MGSLKQTDTNIRQKDPNVVPAAARRQLCHRQQSGGGGWQRRTRRRAQRRLRREFAAARLGPGKRHLGASQVLHRRYKLLLRRAQLCSQRACLRLDHGSAAGCAALRSAT